MRWALPLHVLMVLLVAALTASTEEPVGPAAVPGLMTRIGERIEQYYARARSMVSQETVQLEPLGTDLLPDGSHVRRLVFELRVAWDAATEGARPPEATVLRQLISVDGRAPRAGSASSRSRGAMPDARAAARA